MKIKVINIILFFLFISLVFPGACKKSEVVPTPTSPGGGWISELSGTIFFRDQGFANIEVYLSWGASQKTITDEFGRYKFSNLLSGEYVITPSKLGYAFIPSNYEVSKSQAQGSLNFEAAGALCGCRLGDVASDFTSKDQNNQNVSLYDFFGKVIFFNISSVNCRYSRDEAVHLESIYNQYHDRGLQLITILQSADLASWANEYNLTSPVLDDSDHAIFVLYDGWGMPLNVIVDRNCVIRYRQEGFQITHVKSVIEKYL